VTTRSDATSTSLVTRSAELGHADRLGESAGGGKLLDCGTTEKESHQHASLRGLALIEIEGEDTSHSTRMWHAETKIPAPGAGCSGAPSQPYF